jgi:hypothetical protein
MGEVPMISDQKPRGELEENVRRLFGRLERGGPMSETTRDRILERLLQEASPPRSRRAGPVMGRWIRWASLAAAVFVAVGLLTGDLDDPGQSGGRRVAETPVGSVATKSSAEVKLVSFAIHLLAGGPGRGVVEAASREGGEPVHILPERHVSNADVESAWVEQADSGCQVSIRLTDEGAEKLARLTQDHIGDRLALVIDGEVVMTPTIRSKIGQGLVALTGDFSDSRCQEIARGLSTSS